MAGLSRCGWLHVKSELIPIAERHNDFAWQVAAQLKKAGLRVKVNDSSDRMNAKIRDAQNQKVPYMLVIGDREVEEGAVALRRRSGESLPAMGVDAFIALAQKEVAERL